MRFSDAFGISRVNDDDWFDPHLSIDTKLFLDPLLLLVEGEGEWADAHDELIRHFVRCYELVANAVGPSSTSAQAARRLLTFPEPKEFCLGYTSEGTEGAGSGRRFAQMMMDGIAVAIAAGLRNPQHIEEIGILNVGIGADRISDAVCNVLKHRFISYTQGIAQQHSINMQQHDVRNARCHLQQGRWQDMRGVSLPTNPITGQPVLLVPERFLNQLPILNAKEWIDDALNSDLRLQLNLEMGQSVRKEDIVSLARAHPDRVRSWANDQTSRPDLKGYDFGGDPMGVVHWDKATKEFAEGNPIAGSPPSTQAELVSLVGKVADQFRRFIESQRGWALLWNEDGTEKHEEAAQLVFLGIAQNYLRLFNVEVDREVELGRGPVDFKIAQGTRCRLILEVKKAHNGRFWNGLEHQLPSYMASDDVNEGWFLAIRYRNNRSSEQRMRELPGRVAQVASRCRKTMRYIAVDGRRNPSSASELG